MSNQSLFSKAQQFIPGGVNSPVRAFKGVGGEPVFVDRAKGAYFWSPDDKKYIDYVGSWGPMILGHAHDEVIRAVQNAAEKGLSYGAPTVVETELASKIVELIPSIDKVRMVSSGTEATMSAIRLARGFTGRNKIIKFEGCYHGHSDSLLVKAGSGALTLGVPTSPGVPEELAAHTITLQFNDAEQIREVFADVGEEIACVIIEPVAGNMNCIPPESGYLQTLRDLCDEYASVLIFDEVMTGFRVALGGAQGLYGVTPDMTCFGKVIGGGMPVGAFGGKAAIMNHLAPDGPVYQAGTLSGNPVAMAAGLKTLELLAKKGFYEALSTKVSVLTAGISAAAEKAGVPMATQQVGGMFGLFFTDQAKVTSFAESTACDIETFKKFFHAMLDRGVYLAPSAYEAGFVSSAHTDDDIQLTVESAEQSFKSI